jgi:uncharacterized protein (DUF2384 family)
MKKYLKTVNRVTLDANLLRATAARYSLSLIELAIMLNIPRSVIYRRPLRLTTCQKEHFDHLKELTDLAVQYFGNDEEANRWFRSFNITLTSTPLNLCVKLDGIAQVKNTIYKLIHGMTA